jgi:hypothetical protein
MAVRRVGVLLLVGAALAMPLAAHSQSLPGGVVPTSPAIVPDPGGVVNGAIGTVTSTAGGVTGSGGDSASGTAGSTIGALIGSAETSSGASGTREDSASGRNSASRSETRNARPGRGYRSRFDRLPRRAELLLERIELGRHIQANLRRLRALLAASPELRARVLRALQAELAHLRAHGVTAAERRQIRRLILVKTALASPTTGPASPTAGPALPSSPAAVEASATPPQERAGDVSAARASSERPPNGEPGRAGLPPLPSPGDGQATLLWVVALVLLSLGFLGLAAGVTNHLRRSLREG